MVPVTDIDAEKTKMTIGNFAYTLNKDDFWHGDVTESSREWSKPVLL